MRLYVQAARQHKKMFRTTNCKLKASILTESWVQHSLTPLQPLMRRENQGRTLVLGCLMELFHQAVTFLCAVVCRLCFLGHAVLISICNCNLHKHLNSFQSDLDTHLSCFTIGNWHLFGDGSSRIISFNLPGVSLYDFTGSFLGKMPKV